MVLPHGTHHATPEGRVDFADFSLLVMRHAPSLRTKAHRHEHAMCCTTLHGCGAQVRDALPRFRAAGASGFLAAGERHSDEIGADGWVQLIIELQPALLVDIPEGHRSFERSFDVSAPSLYHAAIDVQRLVRGKPSAAGVMRLRSIGYEMLATFIAAAEAGSPANPSWLSIAHEYLRENFSERPTLERVATACGVHPVHLARVFRAHFSTTIASFMRRLALEDARRALARGDAPVAQIAAAYGYTPAHFSQMFARAYGLSPREFRRRSGR